MTDRLTYQVYRSYGQTVTSPLYPAPGDRLVYALMDINRGHYGLSKGWLHHCLAGYRWQRLLEDRYRWLSRCAEEGRAAEERGYATLAQQAKELEIHYDAQVAAEIRHAEESTENESTCLSCPNKLGDFEVRNGWKVCLACSTR